ncbi:chitosanase [Lacibacter sp.]|uniref:chitosanase n=1 Tax=Lacibacter sp. TaxID=1915409 RepID=UPI002B4B50EA|nr:chitosanase [Lacibacter sp.]HLP35954.1 chitosanase [Lacibacter sp.]
MAITTQQKQKILRVVNVFETGSITGNYGAVTLLKDGPPGADGSPIKQITYGRSQTTEFGNLKMLLQLYVDANGLFADALKPYVNRIGKKPGLYTDTVLLQTLRAAGNSDPVMKKVQDDFFEQLYYQPAFNWFTGMKFTTALSMLVIYDSFIHSGTVPSWLRERFPESVPKNAGDEKTWIKQYVHARHNWLANHKRAILRKTIYRTQCFKTNIAKDNWDLLQVIHANGIQVS